MARIQAGRFALILCSAAFLAGCGDTNSLFKKKPGAETEVTSAADGPSTTKLVERDVEVPEVFQATDQGLWDGRPSLGGVWVAHPNVTEPERVIIRNEANGKFVIGALFKRERENPGPVLQVSSDAAAALGLLAGAPGQLNVTALRRQEVPISGEVPGAEAPTAEFTAAEEIQTATLDDPTDLAAAALDAAGADTHTGTEVIPPVTNVEYTSAPAPSPDEATPPPARADSPLSKPYVQVGLFSMKENADRNGTALRKAGIVPIVVEEQSSGKSYWRVLAGPAPTEADRSATLAKVKKLGYADAYFVKN